jgi:aspartyl-tRNA synthetase
MVETNFRKISKNNENQKVYVGGFVHNIRDHGGLIFIDLRSENEILQCVIDKEKNPDLFEKTESLGPEFVVEISGDIKLREPNLINPNIEAGDIELIIENLEIISDAKILPFPIHEEKNTGVANEDLRLKYRYLDFRRQSLKDILTKRHKFILDVRNWFSKQDFIEIPTPILANSSPEGARDFLIPSRVHPGKFYALPQAPQQFKQLLMVGGFNKYFQIAPCFRDEDPRSDRLVGDFYQIDAEIAWADENYIYNLCNNIINQVFVKHTEKRIVDTQMIKIKYQDAMDKYGTDKPDLRFDLEWVDVKSLFINSSFKVFADIASQEGSKIQALVIPNGNSSFSRSDLDKIQDIGKSFGLPGIAYIQYTKEGPKSPIFKFFGETDSQIQNKVDEITKFFLAKENDLVLFLASFEKSVVFKVQDSIRTHIANKLDLIDEKLLKFVWVYDFPFFEENTEGRIDFGHNPFGKCKGGIEVMKKAMEIGEKEILKLTAIQYDIVLNGSEILSGGVRNQDPKELKLGFQIAGYKSEEIENQFGHMLDAYSYGAPMHAGFAWGIPRLLMILFDVQNVREVVPFPKNGSGIDPLTNSPSEVGKEQLAELSLKIKE